MVYKRRCSDMARCLWLRVPGSASCSPSSRSSFAGVASTPTCPHFNLSSMMRLAIVVTLLLTTGVARAQNGSRLVTARTVAVVAEVEYLRVDKAKYDNQAEVNRILSIVDDSGLFKTTAFPQAPYRATVADKADIIVKISERVALPQTVSITVRDADTNEELFREQRDMVALSNDIKRLVKHFLTSVEEKRAEVERAEEAVREQEREAQAAAEAARVSQQCNEEEANFTRNIISTVIVQHESVPLMTQDILDHNHKCPHNVVVPVDIVKHYQAEEIAKRTAEEARAERVRQVEERQKVLSSWQQELASAPFVIPITGRMRVSDQLPVPTGSYYIIASDEKPDKCTFSSKEMKKLKGAKSATYLGVLECSRTGREAYLVLDASDHYYLIQAVKALGTEQVGTIKDKGTTVCFHDGGCQHILAEVRLMPTDLPHVVHIQPPGPLTATYDSDGLSFKYPQNWRISRKNGGTLVEVVPPEGHVGTWYTLGMFVRHFSPGPSFPPTLAGAFERVMSFYQKHGRVFAKQSPMTVGGREGLMATYTASSPISGEEKGRLILILDSGGYYQFETFSPSPESETNRTVLESVLNTVQFNTTLYATDFYSGTIHNKTADKSTRFEVKIRNDEGRLAGCIGIAEPLYGSGPLKGLGKDGTVTFTVDGDKFDLIFRGKSENGRISGTYTVSPTDVGAVVAQDGEFSLEKTGSKPLLIQPCPTDAEVNAK